MNEYVNKLSVELATVNLDDSAALLSFLPLSARLAVLNDGTQLRRAMQKAKECPGFDRLLLDRCKEGVWDINSALGEFLALAIIVAQDFACLLDLERSSFPEAVQLSIQAWIAHAENASLDESAVDLLEIFLERFPIPEAHRLGIVDSPIEETEREILANAVLQEKPKAVIEVTLRPEAVRAEEFAFADAGDAPALLVDGWSVAEKDLSEPAIGKFLYSQRLYPDWRVVVDINLPDGSDLPAESVRVGPFPATREADTPGRWVLNLNNYPRGCRTRAIDEAVVVKLTNGTRIKIL